MCISAEVKQEIIDVKNIGCDKIQHLFSHINLLFHF